MTSALALPGRSIEHGEPISTGPAWGWCQSLPVPVPRVVDSASLEEWPVASEAQVNELAVREKRQNEANLLAALIIGML
jgi:hypothetical protein